MSVDIDAPDWEIKKLEAKVDMLVSVYKIGREQQAALGEKLDQDFRNIHGRIDVLEMKEIDREKEKEDEGHA